MPSLKIGITGGIGSGKTTVCKIVESMGFPVYYSDERAKWLMENNAELVNGLLEIFGPRVFQNGKLNRLYLAQIVFSNPNMRDAINDLVHPIVRQDFSHFYLSQKCNLVFQESALLFETGGYELLDFTILVTAPENDRIVRVMERDNTDFESVEARMATQMPDKMKVPLANFIIENGFNSRLIPQIQAVITELQKAWIARKN